MKLGFALFRLTRRPWSGLLCSANVDFQAQRAGHSAPTGDELPTRWAWTMVWWRFPWPAGPGYLNCWPFGPKHNNAVRPDLAIPSPQDAATVI